MTCSTASSSSTVTTNAPTDFTGRIIPVDDCDCDERFHDLQLTSVLGAGGYGTVYKALDRTSSSRAPRYYAVKAVQLPTDAEQHDRQIDLLREEVCLQTDVSEHAHVVGLHAVHHDVRAGVVFIVLDYLGGGDLYDAVVERRGYYGRDELVKGLVLQMVDALAFCHKRKVFHRDLKLENILLSEDGTKAYLADFGLATDQSACETFGAGSTGYMAPESFGNEKRATYCPAQADVWSLGIIIFNLVTGRIPWDEATASDSCFRTYLARPARYFSDNFPLSAAASSLLRRVFVLEPAKRPTLRELGDAIRTMDSLFLNPAELARAPDMARLIAEAYMPPPPAVQAARAATIGLPSPPNTVATLAELDALVSANGCADCAACDQCARAAAAGSGKGSYRSYETCTLGGGAVLADHVSIVEEPRCGAPCSSPVGSAEDGECTFVDVRRGSIASDVSSDDDSAPATPLALAARPLEKVPAFTLDMSLDLELSAAAAGAKRRSLLSRFPLLCLTDDFAD